MARNLYQVGVTVAVLSTLPSGQKATGLPDGATTSWVSSAYPGQMSEVIYLPAGTTISMDDSMAVKLPPYVGPIAKAASTRWSV